jgi:hypothetical protein
MQPIARDKPHVMIERTSFIISAVALDMIECFLAANPTAAGVLETYERSELVAVYEFARSHPHTQLRMGFVNLGGLTFTDSEPYGGQANEECYQNTCLRFMPSVLH